MPRPSKRQTCLTLLIMLTCGAAVPPAATTAQPGGDGFSITDLPSRPGDEFNPDAIAAIRDQEAELEEARVVLRTGREFIGVFVERDGRRLTLRVRGEDLRLDLADAVEFEMLGPVVESYRLLRAATGDDDTPARLHIVRWLRDRGAYLTALGEVESILELEPFNNEAIQSRVWLREQIRLQVNKHRAPKDEADGSGPARRRIQAFPVLSPEEINLIRVYEIDFNRPPRLHIPRPAVEQLLDLYGEHELVPSSPEGRQALLRRDPLTVLDLMFRVQARPLYGEVKVLEDPASMRMFREQIHRSWLVGANMSCASSSCHGGQEAGRLFLNNHMSNRDATVYTNFLIMERYRLKDGTPLINYDEPAESPLLQMALPRERSKRPHPEVGRSAGRRGWRPFFRDEDDLRFKRAVEWIQMMYRPRPDYPIDYTPPVPRGVLRSDDLPPPSER